MVACIYAAVILVSVFTFADAASTELYVVGAFGCHLDLYVDGNQLSGLPAAMVYPDPVKIPLSLPYKTVAFAMLPANKAAMFMAYAKDLSLVTSGSWKCTQDTVDNNWMSPSFDDSTWRNPSPMAIQLFDTKTANSWVFPYFKVAACPTNDCNSAASWIASINVMTTMSSIAKKMYCRFTTSGAPVLAATSPPEVEDNTAEPMSGTSYFEGPVYYHLLHADMRLIASSPDDCYMRFRSRIACAQLCTIRWPLCVGFQYSQNDKECCLIDQPTLFLGDRQSVAGFSVWEILGTGIKGLGA